MAINRRITVLLVACAALAVAALLADPFGGARSAVAANHDVVAAPDGLEFSPSSLTIDQGDTVVVYHPEGNQLHNIHWDDQGAACPGEPTFDEWTCDRTFNKTGRFEAICDIHPSMTLNVKVEGVSTPKPVVTPKPTPKPTKKPTPAPTKTPAPERTARPTPRVTPRVTPAPTVAPAPPSTAPTPEPSPGAPSATRVPVATASLPSVLGPSPAATPSPVTAPASSGGEGPAPLLLILALGLGGALAGGAFLRRRAGVARSPSAD
jgi:plastocyanin